jgi:hypothetical protein
MVEGLAWSWLALSIGCALGVAIDEAAGRPQEMAIMHVVWPLTALYMGPLGLAAYGWFGRAPARQQLRTTQAGGGGGQAKAEKPFWQTTFVATTHCGAGCTVGDFCGEWLVFLAGFTLFGATLWAQFAWDFALAFGVGIVFQFFAIAPMRHLGPKEGVKQAIKADALSLVAFEVGMFGWMWLRAWVLYPHDLPPTSPVYWVSMQVAMAVGFLTSYPVNWWLVRSKIKEAM